MVNNLPVMQETLGSIPGSGRCLREGIQYSCLENSMVRGAWWSYSPWGRKEVDTTEQLTHLAIKALSSYVKCECYQWRTKWNNWWKTLTLAPSSCCQRSHFFILSSTKADLLVLFITGSSGPRTVTSTQYASGVHLPSKEMNLGRHWLVFLLSLEYWSFKKKLYILLGFNF